jgi:hypothetical protein
VGSAVGTANEGAVLGQRQFLSNRLQVSLS